MENFNGFPANSMGNQFRFLEDPNAFSKGNVLRVVRLFVEALETTFFLANIFLEGYGVAKIFDIVNQIMPTAYVVNTGYWPFYSNQYGQGVCVCDRFGIRCPHQRNDLHFINMAPLVENMEGYFSDYYVGKLFPFEVCVEVTPILSDILRAYDFNITMTVQQLRVKHNKFAVNVNEKATLTIQARYMLTPVHGPLENIVIQFEPTPLVHHAYNSYFDSMERMRAVPCVYGWETQIPRTYTIVSTDLPRFGINHNLSLQRPFSIYTAVNRPQNNNTLFFGGFPNIWARPDDNTFTVSIRGGPIRNATISAKTFCGYHGFRHSGPSISRNKTQTDTAKTSRPNMRVRFCNIPQDNSEQCISSSNIPPDQEPCCSSSTQERGPSSSQPQPYTELNFLGRDYDLSFPLLPPCSSKRKRIIADIEVTNSTAIQYCEPSSTFDADTEDHIHSEQETVESEEDVDDEEEDEDGNEDGDEEEDEDDDDQDEDDNEDIFHEDEIDNESLIVIPDVSEDVNYGMEEVNEIVDLDTDDDFELQPPPPIPPLIAPFSDD